MQSIKTGKTESLVKAIFRAILFWGAFILLLFLFGSILPKLFPLSWERFVYGISGTGAAVLVTWIFLKNERSHFRSIGLVWEKKTLQRFFRGLLYGILIMGFIIASLLIFTELELKRNPEGISIWQMLFYLSVIPLALMEEIAFRSYPFINLKKSIGVRYTQIIVAIAFALYHLITGWNIQLAFLGPGVWAFVFGFAATRSGGIAVPTGIHVALNSVQSLIGLKAGKYASFWLLDFKPGTPEAMKVKADKIGFILQIIILLTALILTETYMRKREVVQSKI
jgi:uncharacterized protein